MAISKQSHADIEHSRTYGALAADLQHDTNAEVRFDSGSRALYATDASSYRQVPIGVVLPRSVEDVIATVAICRQHKVPVLPRGGGTSLAGQCCNVAVVIDMSKYMHRVLSIDPQARTALVEPGCVLDVLRDAAEEHQLTFGPDPSTHDHNTLGGMIGNNSCGVHSVMAGRTAENIEALEILTYDGFRTWVGATSEEDLEQLIRAGGRGGEIYAGLRDLRDAYAELIQDRYPNIPRRVSGFNLPGLLRERGMHVARALVGSEGTCVTVLRAKVRLIPSPKYRVLAVLGFKDVFAAAAYVPRILQFEPIGLEGMDDVLVKDMEKKNMKVEDRKLLPPGEGWLLCEFGGDTQQDAQHRARRLLDAASEECDSAAHAIFSDAQEAQKLWKVRESGLGATSFVPGQPITHEGWEDAAVPPERLSEYLRAFRTLLDEFEYRGALYGHFGDGCVHTRISSDLHTRKGVVHWNHFVNRAADLVLEHGGSLSGEHGDGQARGELLRKMFGSELMEAMRQFKRIWDPAGMMNPGKVIDAYPLDRYLRNGPDFQHPKVATSFSYQHDQGDFLRATMRCVGVGECRREWGAVMCPSYQATREEMHSTRGRARLLFEMVRGMNNGDTPLQDGWRNKSVHEALELCLSCKGCKVDCPVNVDMATYKSEFAHHYYRGRLRPRMAYSMGLIYWWARIGQPIAPLVNALTHAPGTARLFKALGGIAPEREVPKFSSHPFTATYDRAVAPDQASLCLWPDTFTNFFRPQALHAAAKCFEHLQYQVALPTKLACCARPLFAEGMLDLARKQLSGLMDALNPAIARELPIVGLEPSCIASFRDELLDLFPADERARYLKENTFTFAEFLQQRGFSPPRLARDALVHMHCNHRAVMGTGAEAALLSKLFEHHSVPEPGCCGMAGPFGFAAEKYPISMKIAERVLLPNVRRAAPDTWLIADGFSCREQILQGTSREPVHLAEAVWAALDSQSHQNA